jgi:FkbM family methyltransferase
MRFYGQWEPKVDEVLFKNFFPEKRNGLLVECGAGDGLTESCGKFFVDERGWTAVNVEPDAERFSHLCRNRQHLPGPNININLALSDRDSSDSLTFIRGPHADQQTVSSCITWGTLVGRLEFGLGADVAVDLLVLDVEGHELSVIRGMAGCPLLPEVICAEYPWPTTGLKPLTEALVPLGYHLWFLSHNNAFYSQKPRPDGPFFGETGEFKS